MVKIDPLQPPLSGSEYRAILDNKVEAMKTEAKWRDNFYKQNPFKEWNKPRIAPPTDEELKEIDEKLKYILNPYNANFGVHHGPSVNRSWDDKEIGDDLEIAEDTKEEIENDLVSRLFEVLLELSTTEGYEEEPWWTDMLILAERFGVK